MVKPSMYSGRQMQFFAAIAEDYQKISCGIGSDRLSSEPKGHLKPPVLGPLETEAVNG